MFKRIILSVAVILFCAGRVYGEKITVVTEEWPPYNYSENGQVGGVVTDIVRATLDRAGFDYTIIVYPWARAYDMTKGGNNVLIYSIFKLPSRERSFKWIKIDGLSVNMHLFRPKFRNDLKIASLEEAKGYRIGVTRETSTHHYLVSKGFSEGVNLFPVNCEEQNAFKSTPENMRVDLTTGDKLSLARWLKVSGFPPDYWVEVLPLFQEDIYMAFGLSTADEVVDAVRSALAEIKAEGLLSDIEDRYYREYQQDLP